MALAFRHKEQFFHRLAKLMDSGLPFSRALTSMARDGRGMSGKIALGVAERKTDTIGAALGELPRWFSPLDRAIIEAGERGGNPAEAARLLSEYHGALAAARRRVIRLSSYPVVVYHLAAIVLAVPLAIFAGDAQVFFVMVGLMLGGFYALLLVVGGLIRLGVAQAARSPGADRALGRIPVLGALLRTWSAAQFATALSMQVRAGVGVLSGLRAAANAGRSANLREAVERVVTDVKGGEALGACVVATGAFPQTLEEAFATGEEAGRLDEELLRAAEILRGELFARIELLAEWCPRILYAGVVIVVGYLIVSTYLRYLEMLNGLFDM